MEYITLNNGISMPLEGFGVFQVTDPSVCEASAFMTLSKWAIVSSTPQRFTAMRRQ